LLLPLLWAARAGSEDSSPPVRPGGGSLRSEALQFTKQVYGADEAREGHVTLTWNELQGATEYAVTDQSGATMYHGVHPQAFVSGLANGVYEFRVAAIDDAGREIASTAVPAMVTVKHWPLSQALALFFCGLLVFLTLVCVIYRGSKGSTLRRGDGAGDNTGASA
jgi:hypothetical protein